ncbi:MAG: amino acid permease [Treponema sp.]|nr:amino acid permease [Treponema sp.]
MHKTKKISLLGVFSIAAGAMISSGIFILPSLAFAQTGPSAIISYAMAGILAVIGMQSIIEMSTAMPKTGGDYFYIHRSLGPFVGTISGILGWLALSLKSSFAVFGFSEIVQTITGLPSNVTALILIVIFMLLNIRGAKEVAGLQIILVVFLIAIMILFCFSSIGHISAAHYKPFVPNGIAPVFITSGFIFISFGGLLKVANMAEEIEKPEKTIPKGMFLAVGVVTLLYAATVFGVIGVLDSGTLSVSLEPVAEAGFKTMGLFGYIIISIAACLAFITTANSGIMAASRYLPALAKDGLIPSFFAATRKGRKTPVPAIILTAGFMYFSLFLKLTMLVKISSTVILISYVLTNISVIVLRESGISSYRPSFKTPFYPFLQIFSIVVFSCFIFALGNTSLELIAGFILFCALVYVFYGRKHSSAEYALLHLIKKICDKQISEGVFENELRDIVFERDNIKKDELDHLVKTARVFDIDHALSFKSLILLILHKLTADLLLTESEIYEKYISREQDTGTCLDDFTAIPHIITPEGSPMRLIIVRCRDGIEFPSCKSIRCALVLSGPPENREEHLKILSQIAVTVGKQKFRDRWLSADTPQALKNVLMLERERHK